LAPALHKEAVVDMAAVAVATPEAVVVVSTAVL
jgi:hypothetical protein